MSMSLRLSEDAVRGTASYRPDPEVLEALQSGDTKRLLALSHRRWGPLGQMMADDDDTDEDESDEDDDDSEDGDDDEEDDSEDDGDDEDEDSPEGKKSKKSGDDKDKGQQRDPQKKIQALEDEKNRLFRGRAKARKERDDALAEVERIKKDGTDDKELQKELTESKAQVTKLSGQLQDALLRIAFLSDTTYEWADPGVALKAADLSKIEIDDDGTVMGMTDALDALAKNSPFLLKPRTTKRVEPKKGATGQRPAKKTTSQKKAERDRIRAKYGIRS